MIILQPGLFEVGVGHLDPLIECQADGAVAKVEGGDPCHETGVLFGLVDQVLVKSAFPGQGVVINCHSDTPLG